MKMARTQEKKQMENPGKVKDEKEIEEKVRRERLGYEFGGK